jgi:glycosyltransferase involved in cell wall biosynthesis
MPARSIRSWQPLPIHGRPKVSLAVATYQQTDELACLLYSFKAQTYDHWEVVLVHDGPGPEARAVVDHIGDARIRLIETPEHRGQYGHPWRQFGIEQCTGDYIGLSNGDNYYAPVYFEWMLYSLVVQDADFAYCNMVHSYLRWAPFTTRPEKGGMDLGAWIARAALVKATPWWDLDLQADGTFVEDLLRKTRRIIHVPACLFVHN